MFWILLSVGLPVFFYIIFIKPFTYWSNKGVPQHSKWTSWTRILKAFLLLKPPAEGFQQLYNSFPNKRYIGIYRLSKPALFLRDPDLIKQITVKDFDHFTDRSQILSDDSDPLWEKSLFSLKGEKWRDMRSKISPTFTSSKMKIMFGLMCECAENFVRYFESQCSETITVEMKDIFGRFSIDLIASTAFGNRCDSLKDQENDFYKMGKKAANFGGLKLILLLAAPRLCKLLGVKLFSEDVRSFFKNLIMESVEVREQKGIVRPDMIHLLMEARKGKLKHDSVAVDAGFAATEEDFHGEQNVSPQQLSDDDITAQAFGFFLAGFETVSSSMSFVAYELAVNPDIQERLQSEIDDVANACNGSVTYDALVKMKYLDMVMSESLRKWPPAIAIDRICVQPYTITPTTMDEKPLHLNKGEIIMLPVYALHRDPLLYPEPDRFDPERFSDDNKHNIKPYTYFPFGVGPRSCIGSRFALMEMKVVFFHLLSKFHIKVVDKTTVPLQIGPNPVSLSSKHGFWLGLKPRNSES